MGPLSQVQVQMQVQAKTPLRHALYLYLIDVRPASPRRFVLSNFEPSLPLS